MKALIISELRQRIRGKRWWILLALWFLALWGLLWMVHRGAESTRQWDPSIDAGLVMFGSLVLFVLGLACLIVPALTSTSINGERDRGTLAVLQSTMLRPSQILGAKFLAGLAIAAGFIVATIPLAAWSATKGDFSLGRAVIVYLILFLISGLLLMIGLAASALVRRPALSAVVAYGLVFLLTAGTPILFGLSLLTADEQAFERRVGWRWVILAPNPFVILADAAPRSDDPSFSDPLEGIRNSVREARRPPSQRYIPPGPEGGIEVDPLTGEPIFPEESFAEPPTPVEEPPALWPAGTAIDAALVLLGAYFAYDRLRIPARRLAPGERVA